MAVAVNAVSDGPAEIVLLPIGVGEWNSGRRADGAEECGPRTRHFESGETVSMSFQTILLQMQLAPSINELEEIQHIKHN